MKRINLRLNVTEEERDTIRKAAALANHRSMAEFCRAVVLRESGAIIRDNVAQSVARQIHPDPHMASERSKPDDAIPT